MNIVEIIIKAVDKYSREMKKVSASFKDVAKAGAAVAGGIALAYKSLETFGQIARDLGFEKTAKQVDYMTQSLKDAEVAILKTNIGGLQLQEWLGQAASGMGTVIRLIGIGLVKVVNDLTIAFHTLHLGLAQIIPGMESYTKAMFDADVALANYAFQTTVADIATVGLAKSLESGKRKLSETATATKKQTATVFDLIAANKKLKESYMEIEDAIRAGDARALAAARAGKGGLDRGASRQVQGGGAGGSTNKGDTTVNVIMDGQVIARQTRKTIAEDLFKPIVKQSGTGKR